MMRMSTFTGLVPPTRSISRSWMARSSLACRRASISLIFVQQQRAAVCFLELADAPGDGAGEGALLVAEELGFQQVLGDRGAVDGDEGLVGALRLAVDVARHHLLARAALTGDEDGGFGARHLVGQRDDGVHRLILVDHLVGFIGDGRQHRGDQLGIGRQRQVFLGARADGVHGAARIGADAAGDDRRADALGREAAHQVADVALDVAQHQVRANAAAQGRHALFDVGRMRDFRAAIHGDLGCRAELALQSADDE